MSDPTTDLTPADVDAIIKLVGSGVHVQRTTMYGDSYTSVSWVFCSDDDDDGESVTDDDLAYLQGLK